MKNPDPQRYEVEAPVEYKGFIYGNIDLYDNQLQIVIDIKEKIVNGTWEVKPLSSQEEQLKDLMAMKGVSRGVLILILLNGKEGIKQFNYYMNPEECQMQLNKLEQKARLFLNTKNEKDPYLAPHVFFNKNLNWLCHRVDMKMGQDIWCPYYWDCFPMIRREKEKQTDTETKNDNDDVESDDPFHARR